MNTENIEKAYIQMSKLVHCADLYKLVEKEIIRLNSIREEKGLDCKVWTEFFNVKFQLGVTVTIDIYTAVLEVLHKQISIAENVRIEL